MTVADQIPDVTLLQLAEGQTLVLSKLDVAIQMLEEVLQLVSPPPPEEGDSLREVLIRIALTLDQQGIALGRLALQTSRLEQLLTTGGSGQ